MIYPTLNFQGISVNISISISISIQHQHLLLGCDDADAGDVGDVECWLINSSHIPLDSLSLSLSKERACT